MLQRSFLFVFLLIGWFVVGLSQVPVANNEDPDFRASNRPACLSRGGHYRVLQRAMDSSHDDLFRSYVHYYYPSMSTDK